MILGMIFSVALAGSDMTASAPQTSEALIAQATDWLLNGESLPPDMDRRLQSLPPGERMRVLVFLRRSGMFTGADWSIEKILAPAINEVAPK